MYPIRHPSLDELSRLASALIPEESQEDLEVAILTLQIDDPVISLGTGWYVTRFATAEYVLELRRLRSLTREEHDYMLQQAREAAPNVSWKYY